MLYEADYFKTYRMGGQTVDYVQSQQLKDFMHGVAEQICQNYKPKTVLDCGCASGHLVAALRDLGVEAYGIDISAYAVSQAREDIQPFCAVQSLLEKTLPASFPKKFDLVVTIEVLEHLAEADGQKAIANLCTWGDQVLFSSTNSDFDDPSHINVRQSEYWAKSFAESGFYNDLDIRPAYISDYAHTFKNHIAMPNQVAQYEQYLRIARKRMLDSEGENVTLHQQVTELVEQNRDVEQELEKREAELFLYKEHSQKIEKENNRLKKETIAFNKELHHLRNVERAYIEVVSSKFWRITGPARRAGTICKKILHLTKKSIFTLKNDGLHAMIEKIKNYNFNGTTIGTIDYNTYIAMHWPTEKELEWERKAKFNKDVTFSILVPLYNTQEDFLREMIDSVIAQSYSKWELCLADGSDDEHVDVQRIVQEYVQKDCRIKYKKLEKNEGISGNTNACLDMATGNYIALFDHDDLLHPSALFKNMEKIEKEDADFLYSDEMTFQGTMKNCVLIHFKPDFSEETLLGHNYICHFTVYSRALFEKVGYFSTEHDGSQDYDMVLRLTEQAKQIVHIPEVIYFWRSHANSVASDISAKPYCMVSAKKAITDHLERVGKTGTVVDSAFLSTYRVKYELKEEPLISIIIPNKDYIDDLDNCIASIYKLSTYQNFEIIIVENNSTEIATFEYYKNIQKLHGNLHVVEWKKRIFNYSAINNFGISYAKGDYILLLNNDIEVISPDWMESMLMFAQQDNVGAVGPKLFYPDETVQHAGVILGLGGVAAHAFLGWGHDDPGYAHRLSLAQNLSCVTAACLLTKRSILEQIDGLDEAFQVAFNDVDLCMKIRKSGYDIIFTPYAELYHYESKSRGREDTPEKIERFNGEAERFIKKWKVELEAGDPYYNPNLTLDNTDFSVSAQNRIS